MTAADRDAGRKAMERVLHEYEQSEGVVLETERAHLSQLYTAAAEREALRAEVERLLAIATDYERKVIELEKLNSTFAGIRSRLASAERVVEAAMAMLPYFTSGNDVPVREVRLHIDLPFVAEFVAALRSHDAECGEGERG